MVSVGQKLTPAVVGAGDRGHVLLGGRQRHHDHSPPPEEGSLLQRLLEDSSGRKAREALSHAPLVESSLRKLLGVGLAWVC